MSSAKGFSFGVGVAAEGRYAVGMTGLLRTRTWLAGTVLAASLMACAGPTPSPAVPATVETATTSLSAAPSALATVAPTVAPSPKPVPSLAAGGVEVFQQIQQGHWVIVSSSDNLGEIDHSSVLLPIGDTLEINSRCAGAGSLHVVATAAAPATDPPDPQATTLPVFEAVVDCPETTGESYLGGGTMAPGWFVSIDATPSDPSIRYQVLAGTIVD